jgi:peptidoglycan/xylan/chitin deacetylase (PgdA/CDA1 family)
LNYEEGSEPNPLLGDATRELLTDPLYSSVPPGERELFQESAFEYGSRVGHWRVIEVLDEYEMPCSVFATAMALELNPPITSAFVKRGWDMVGHGYRWLGHHAMSEDEERNDIRQCIASIRRLTGQTITGWFNRPPISLDTRRILAEEGLFWDSSSIDDDLPHYTDVAGRPLLIVPYSLENNDTRFWKAQGFVTATDFFEYNRDAFDVLYRESARVPRMISIGLHGRIIGRPGRTPGLQRLLGYIRSQPGVWVAPRSEIARVWAEQFASDDAWNWNGGR